MRAFLTQRPFLALGIVTLGLFFLVETLQAAGLTGTAAAAAAPMRVLIVPMYLVWVVLTMLRVAVSDAPPTAIDSVLRVIQLAAGFAPYLLADHLLAVWKRRRAASLSH